MQGPYLAIQSNPESEELLKEEINIRFPELRPSFSAPGFLTYKCSQGVVSEKDLTKFLPVYSLKVGMFYAKVGRKQVAEKLKQLEKDLSAPYVIDPTSSQCLEIDQLVKAQNGSLPKINDWIVWIYLYEQKECWITIYPYRPPISSFGLLPSAIPKDAPSRAYLKMAQTFARLKLNKVQDPQTFLEIGCAPGGVAYFLLQEGHFVLGIDTGDMDQKLLNSPMADRLKTIRRSVQEVRKGDIEKSLQRLSVPSFEWLANDLNLPIPMAFNEAMRISQYSQDLWGLLITLKTPSVESLPQLMTAIKKLSHSERDFCYVQALHLPAHKKECLLVALKEKACKVLEIGPLKPYFGDDQDRPKNN
ncbi:MAG: hypothetical protein A2X86_05255 [Bdellovibrionales bacterium GWA2_49_15]|nr:MAG: hypothetical protein A2X86_05255 [Bdellovibrionales bacterium GWA2_49_15]